MSNALANYVAELGEVPAQGVDQLGALAHEQVAPAEHNCRGLGFSALALDEPHRWALCGLADRFRVSPVVLLALDERLHVSRVSCPARLHERLRLISEAGEMSSSVSASYLRLSAAAGES